MTTFLSTIIHSGTKSFREVLLDGNIEHTFYHFTYAPEAEKHFVQSAARLITTYRNPYHVAVSWANHGRLKVLRSKSGEHNWYAQWQAWANFISNGNVEVIDIARYPNCRGSMPDTHELYSALEAHDFKKYFNVVPQDAIQFAVAQVFSVRQHLTHIELGV